MMKFQQDQTQTSDHQRFRKRVACLCFPSSQEDEAVLVSSSWCPHQGIIPGGRMEPEEEAGGAAVREVYDEAGVKGKLGRPSGVLQQNQDQK